MSRKSIAKPSGTTVVLEYDSRVLAGNPLGDPHVRKLAVWLPPGYDDGALRGRNAGRGRRFPVLFDLVGFTGSGLAHLNGRPFDECFDRQRIEFCDSRYLWCNVTRVLVWVGSHLRI